MLTNYREAPRTGDGTAVVRTRGELTVGFLHDHRSPEAYLNSVSAGAQSYRGFNLAVADLRERRFAYLCHPEGEGDVAVLHSGAHGISNGHMRSAWPKVTEGLAAFTQLSDEWMNALDANTHPGECPSGASGTCFAGDDTAGRGARVDELASAVFGTVMGNNTKVEQRERLPQTGVGEEAEYLLSSIFLDPFSYQGSAYGTRTQTVLVVWRDGHAEWREQNRNEQGSWSGVSHTFHIEGMSAGHA